MHKELTLWQFIAKRLERDEAVMLLVVAESSGSSPGRAGYKMAVGADGELCGSIGGGVMEVRLVEQAKAKCKRAIGKIESEIAEQIHRRDVENSSGMICSGKQSIIFRLLEPENGEAINKIIESHGNATLEITHNNFCVISGRNASVSERARTDLPTARALTVASLPISPPEGEDLSFYFEKASNTEFTYSEKLGYKNDLYIIGGGHCALALSELMSKLDFHISIFDDRPELNTLEKNAFADEIKVIENYDRISEFVSSASSAYVVVMTLGYKSDAVVIRSLVEKDFKYFGVLGSKAKMAALMKELKAEGLSSDRLARIHTPIGLAINSRTPEEIAVSIAAEIIAIKNA